MKFVTSRRYLNHEREGFILYPKMRGKKFRILWKIN